MRERASACLIAESVVKSSEREKDRPYGDHGLVAGVPGRQHIECFLELDRRGIETVIVDERSRDAR